MQDLQFCFFGELGRGFGVRGRLCFVVWDVYKGIVDSSWVIGNLVQGCVCFSV